MHLADKQRVESVRRSCRIGIVKNTENGHELSNHQDCQRDSASFALSDEELGERGPCALADDARRARLPGQPNRLQAGDELYW